MGCVIFHDVDLVPINDLNPYGCDKEVSKNVIHLGVGLDVRNFKLSYPQLVGGVLKMTTEQFVSVNGFSNKYWGWGQEDDDMERRLRRRNLNYIHISPSIARYAAMTHDKQPKVRRDEHLDLLKSAHIRMINDGLNTLKYRLIYVQEKSLFTLILVDLVGSGSEKEDVSDGDDSDDNVKSPRKSGIDDTEDAINREESGSEDDKDKDDDDEVDRDDEDDNEKDERVGSEEGIEDARNEELLVGEPQERGNSTPSKTSARKPGPKMLWP
ncbi:Beta-1,4-galactosyltransferase 4 [Clonorchis sinensis]|uniref:Beta-1,4-galactosyltransferase 4 n=1 Tax=Clonorchis sinensis TaxID=79923 RepID=A0A3R7JWX7_CLOSI|nr:Beta-1,4-galactosyltransferase 4 [Clonorchis sinensis]